MINIISLAMILTGMLVIICGVNYYSYKNGELTGRNELRREEKLYESSK